MPENLWRSKKPLFKLIKSRLDDTGYFQEDSEDEEYELDDLEELAPEKIELLLQHLIQVALHGDQKSQYSFFQLLAETDKSISPGPAFFQAVTRENLPAEPYLFPFAKDLVFKTDKINAVKAGLHLLRACKKSSVLDDIKTIGAFEPLKIHVIAAIKEMATDPVMELWEFGRTQSHYGIMLVVREFRNYPVSQEIKDWILFEGYSMGLIPADWAVDFAVTGELDEKLKPDSIDYELYKYARHYISCLADTELDSEGMYVYEPAETTIKNFLRHARQYATEVSDYYHLHEISEFLRFFGSVMKLKNKDGVNYAWTFSCREEIEDILRSRDWEEQVLEALTKTENPDYFMAKEVAAAMGIDPSDYLLKRLQNKPTDNRSWEEVVQNHKRKDVDPLIRLALDHLPWEKFTSGPGNSKGIYFDQWLVACMSSAISLLDAYPGEGEQIILYALKSVLPRHRTNAIRVLNSWKKKNWSPEIREAMERVAAGDGDRV